MSESKTLLTTTIFNPALLSKEDLLRGFVARQDILNRLMDDLRRVQPGTPPQHQLILGQRGLGKTSLLRRLAFAIEDDPTLSKTWLPLVFPEEQYNVSSLGDFWLNCADALSDALDRMGDVHGAEELDRKVADVPAKDERRTSKALAILVDEAERLKRGVVLLVDNLDIILDRLDENQEWEFRKIISAEHRLYFIGASSRALEALYAHGRAFYDYFEVHELKGLNDEETFAVLRRLATDEDNQQVKTILNEKPARVRALRVLTGGNPRTLMLLYRVLSQGPGSDVQRDIEQLLDLYTPLYKARFEEMPAQAQQIVVAMAMHWDPVTAGDLAIKLSPLSVNQVSAQLKRLEDVGVVEKTPWFGKKKAAFQIAERFFNIWCLMRASRRVRRKLIWLVRFLEAWFEREELNQQARSYLNIDPILVGRARYAEMALAYSQAVQGRNLRRSLESAGLRAALHESVRGQFDFTDLSPDIQGRKERMSRNDELKSCVLKLKLKVIDNRELWRLLGGSPLLSLEEKAKVVDQLASMNATRVARLYEKLRGDESLLKEVLPPGQGAVICDLYEAISSGEMADPYDIDAAFAKGSADHCGTLPALSIYCKLHPDCASGKMSQSEISRVIRAIRTLRSEPGCEANSLWLEGVLDRRKGKSKAAEDAYLKALELDPSHINAWYDLASLLESLERYDEAEKSYRKVIEIDSGYARAWFRMGLLLENHHERYHEAENAYCKAIEINSGDFHVWLHLGILLEDHLKQFNESEHAYRHAISLNPESSYCVVRLGALLEDHFDRYEEAERSYRQALKVDSADALAWLRLGSLLEDHLNRYGEAEQAYRRGIEEDPNDPRLWISLATILEDRLKRYEEAECAFRRAIDLDPNNDFAWGGMAILLEDHLRRYEDAEQAYRRSIELDPNEAYIVIRLGRLLEEHIKDYSEAERMYRRAIDIAPKEDYYWVCLGSLLVEHSSRYEEAEHAFRRASELDPKEPVAWISWGRVLEDHLSRFDEAERAYRHALSVDPGGAYGWYCLGELLTAHLGRYDEAEHAYKKAFEADPSDYFVIVTLGILFENRFKRSKEAEETYRKALQIKPDYAFGLYHLGSLIGRETTRHGEALEYLLQAAEIDPEEVVIVDEVMRIARTLDSERLLQSALERLSRLHDQLPGNSRISFALAELLTRAGQWSAARALLEQILPLMNDSELPEFGMIEAAVQDKHLKELLMLFEKTGADERWRPLYQALKAVEAGSSDYLLRVAPEIRTVARSILREIAPELHRSRRKGLIVASEKSPDIET